MNHKNTWDIAVVGGANIGADERGKAILKRLKEEGVDTKYIVSDEKEPTGVALIMVGERGEKGILTAPGVNRQFSVNEANQAGPRFSPRGFC